MIKYTSYKNLRNLLRQLLSCKELKISASTVTEVYREQENEVNPALLISSARKHREWCCWPLWIHFIPMNMGRSRVRGNLRMRKQNTKTTVPLDVVPERRTKRFSPRFRPGGRFCELRFRYLSSPTGREGEISRPLDHMRQIPFIHSARPLVSTNYYIYRTVLEIFSPCGTLRCVLM